MAFHQGIPFVVDIAEACLFVLGFLDIRLFPARVTKVNISVKPGLLQLDNVVLGLAHGVRQAVARIQVRRTVRQDDVFGGHKHGNLPP